MWGLDRITPNSTLSGIAAPPPRRDSYSPAPRRPYPAGPGPLPPRPGLIPRSSSLNILSPNASNTSLPLGSRAPNGAGRRRPNGGAPLDLANPIQVLSNIMGGPPRKPVNLKQEDADSAIVQKPEEVEEDIDFGGMSLKDFAAAAEVEATTGTRLPSSVHTYSAQSVEECTCLHPEYGVFAYRDCSRQGERQI